MEASTNPTPTPNIPPIRNTNNNSILSSTPVWPTIDGPLGLTEEDSLPYARKFYAFGYALLPWLWALNCFYFWPVLRHSRSFPHIRPCNFLNSIFLLAFWGFFSLRFKSCFSLIQRLFLSDLIPLCP